MSNEPPRPPRDYPPSTVQAAGQAAESVISGLKQQPALLAIVVLNVIMISAMFWFMSSITEAVKTNRDQLLSMVSRCLNHDGREDRQ